MQTIEYHTTDKSTWGPGAWQSEPDKKQWQDPATGLPCLIVRGPSGALCGYVGVTKSHPLFMQDYDDTNISVHGGLTFAHICSPGAEEESICHIPDPGESDHVWWFGFDCAHVGDETPRNNALLPTHLRFRFGEDTYRDFSYVTREVISLALQLKAIADG